MSLINDPSSFELTTSFDGPIAVLALHGSVESIAAFDLWTALEGAIHLQRESVVLDLSDRSRRAAGSGNAEKSYAEVGVDLTVRTPSRLVRRLLTGLELTEVARPDQTLASLGHLSRELVGERHHPSNPSISRVSTEDLGRATAIPTDSDAVEGARRLVVGLAQTSAGGADEISGSADSPRRGPEIQPEEQRKQRGPL